MNRLIALTLAALCGWTSVCQATPMVIVGTHLADSSAPVFTLDLMVTGGDLISTVDMNIQLGSGLDNTPKITAVSVVDTDPGWTFAPNGYGNAGSNSSFSPPGQVLAATDQFWEIDNITVSGTVPAIGRILRISFDFTGAPFGIYPLNLLSNIFENPSNYSTPSLLGAPFAGQDGQIFYEPEPSALVLGLLGATCLVGLGVVRRRSP